MKTELTFFWLATIIYGFSAFFYIWSFISETVKQSPSGKEKFLRWGIILTWAGFLVHTVSLVWYWIAVGGEAATLHAYTVLSRVSGTAWVGILVFLFAQLFTRPIRPAGLLVMPITLLLLFGAGISSKEIGTISSVLTTWWFWVHISSGGFAYGFVLLAGATALLYLLEERRGDIYGAFPSSFSSPPRGEGQVEGAGLINQTPTISEKLPELPVPKTCQGSEEKELDNLDYRFVGLGFIMLTIMIISGSLWANQVHGRYWGWDPIEVQSLISWLIYAIWLHLRLTFGWRGRKLAWYSLFALVVIGFNLAGVPFIEKVFHSGFRIQH